MGIEKKDMSGMDRNELYDHYEEIREIAMRDALTGLLNRGALERGVRERLQNKKPEEGCALLIMDLDNFKAVNDTLGHQTGDQVLAKAARLLAGMFRSTDIVGRLGGDEFMVFLSGKVTESMIRRKGQMICDQIQFMLGTDLLVTASVGIHLALDGSYEFEALYRSADLALYESKNSGKQSYCIKTTLDENGPVRRESRPVNAVRLRSLLDSIDSGVAMIEMMQPIRFMYVSAAFARMLEMEADELIGFPTMNLIHPEDRDRIEKLLRDQVMTGKDPVIHELRVIVNKGEIRWLRSHAVRVEDHDGKPVILITAMDMTEVKERENSLVGNQELLRISGRQTTRGIWEMDLETKSFRLISGIENFSPDRIEFHGKPGDLVKKGWVDPESADSFREFSREIMEGRQQGYANFKIHYRESEPSQWAAFSYRTVYDEDGKPVRVIGMIESMNRSTSEEQVRQKSVTMPESLTGSLLLRARGNLSADRVLFYWDEAGEEAPESCTELLEREIDRETAEKAAYPDMAILSRDNLLIAGRSQRHNWIIREYHRKNPDGTLCPVSCVINLYPDSQTGDRLFAIWISDLKQRRQWEGLYPISVGKDPISKLYTRSTVRELASRLLERQEHRLCALVMLEVGGMARLYAKDNENLDMKWRAITAALMLALGTACIPGQSGAEQFLVFFPEIPDEIYLKRRLEQAILFVRSITSDLVDGNMIRFVVGAICRYQDETEYDILLKKAQQLCERWSNGSGDRIAFAEDEETEDWAELRTSQAGDQIRVSREDTARPLSEREQTYAFSCLLEMLNTDSLEDSARCVLRTLGEYYEADRVYILELVEHGQIVTMPHEWTSGQKRSIQQIVSGSPASAFPLILRCARENRPVLLTRQISAEDQEREKEQMWHYAVFPVRESGFGQSYLCVENARNHMSDATLSMLLISCMIKERRHLLRGARIAPSGKSMPGVELPNYSSYLEVIYSFTSDVYSTLGTVVIDVPGFSSINSSLGFEYGRRLLWYAIQSMTEIFGQSMIYRTWDAEFVILCPNTSKELFLGKCARLRSVLIHRYPREFRIGSAWSDGVFSGKALVEEAKTVMRGDAEDANEAEVDAWLPEAEEEEGETGEIFFSGEEDLSQIYRILKKQRGIDFALYKKSTVMRRIERRMAIAHVRTLEEYVELLMRKRDEADALAKEILIGVTNFFRDPEYFEQLKRRVILPILKRAGEEEEIRVWSAGCSTGEEAYSVAILFKEGMEELGILRRVKIFATDVDADAVDRAGKGVFPDTISGEVSRERLSRFFIRQNGCYHIVKEIRRMILFAPHNIFADPPFGRLDLIVCRNVMIYFQPALRKRMFSIFHTALKKDGYLFLGRSETVSDYMTIFRPVCTSEKIYLHCEEGKSGSLAMHMEYQTPELRMPPHREERVLAEKPEIHRRMPDYLKFLERHLPAACVINGENQVIHFFGNYADYLSLAPGRASFDFWHMIHPDLKMAARAAVGRCRTEKQAFTYTEIPVDCAGKRRLINLAVEPVEDGEEEGIVAVLFLEKGRETKVGQIQKFHMDEAAARRIAALEYEFQVSQNDLRSTIQRLETVNGELQAANEELLTANEELQSSTEELQSVNEELYTVNIEHQIKLEELTTMTNDLSNCLSSTMIGILFVDSSLNIRKFTEYVEREFQLMECDIGRPVQIFAHSFPDEDLEGDCRKVLAQRETIDRTMTAANGQTYAVRIAPYRTMEQTIRGLVITVLR